MCVTLFVTLLPCRHTARFGVQLLLQTSCLSPYSLQGIQNENVRLAYRRLLSHVTCRAVGGHQYCRRIYAPILGIQVCSFILKMAPERTSGAGNNLPDYTMSSTSLHIVSTQHLSGLHTDSICMMWHLC
jgi:hypothetical protein